VLRAPGGLAALLEHAGVLLGDVSALRRRARVLGAKAAAALIALCGFILLVEMTYYRTLEATGGSIVRVFWTDIDTGHAGAWALGCLLLTAGVLTFAWLRRQELAAWEPASTSASVGDAR